MAVVGRGLKAIAKQGFEEKVRNLVSMTGKSRTKTLIVGRKVKEGVVVEVVDGVPLDAILKAAEAQRYEHRKEFAPDGLASKLYLARKAVS